MPNYEYRCAPCGSIITTFNHGGPPKMPPNCPSCGSPPHRLFGFSTPHPNSSFQPHFNNSVGKVVTSQKHFEDELKRGAERNSIRTGIYHNYIPKDPRDRVGVTEEGLYEGAKGAYDLNHTKLKDS